jgi:leucyl-tRNA synthetase
MFPYPSGRIHIGHVRNYSIGDVLARYKFCKGFNVLHPMGWDAFGMPAENAAIAEKTHPADWTFGNIDYMRHQIQKMGLSYDWDREIASCHPGYYKWNQWFFLKLLERGLAYRSKSFVNWCPSCNTVLANEQVESGLCWRCSSVVTQKELEQWNLKITDYAQKLLDGCDELTEGWPERVLTMQRNWIGKSYGAEVDFPLADGSGAIKIYTTRQDTLYGATFMCLAPEHPLCMEMAGGTDHEEEVRAFVDEVIKEDKITRTAEAAEKRGVFTGKYAINPMNGEHIPVWVADFVLMEYGTGAIMAVPAHDQRDLDFARKYGIPVRVVIHPHDGELDQDTMTEAYVNEGYLVNSDVFNGTNNTEALTKVGEFLEDKDIGKRTINYRIRDWGISRQRYWGTPIPIIYCRDCGAVPAPYDDLPVVLPLEVEIKEHGKSPLPDYQRFVETECPRCGAEARRETDTMDTFVCSSWYFDRYTCPRYDEGPLEEKALNYWMPVDQYIGGIEHAVLHLLYSRFFTMVLRDMGIIREGEPYTRLLTQGMVIKDGAKMSKSRGNVVDPDEIVSKYGTDTIRLFMLFASPPERDLEWSERGVEGAFRFLNRVWRLVNNHFNDIKQVQEAPAALQHLPENLKAIRRKTHQTIRKVTRDIEDRYHFNTAIAAIMELTNELYLLRYDREEKEEALPVIKEALESLIMLLYPFTPHISEEIWKELGGSETLTRRPWPEYDESIASEEEISIVIQINGKMRSLIRVEADTGDEEIKALAMENEKIVSLTKDKDLKKVIVVPKKLVNIVVK